MCGIFGVINTKEMIDEGRILAARDILAHRGPDDEGIYLSTCHPEPVEGSHTVALAHRRLSIIDLSPAAHQPMTTTNGRYTIVYNGEIYNYKELSKQIPVMSNRFNDAQPSLITDHSSLRTNSDTEVILNLYIDYGKDCLQYLRGMFAFAIWDDKEKTFFAARDRFGIKPFYYLKNDNEFIFSSELKAIKHYKKDLTISNEGIDAFLRTGSVPAPLTIYEEVSSLLPGHWLEWQKSNVKCQKYWEFNDLFEESAVLSPQSSKGNDIMDSHLRENDRQDIISNEENVISSEARNLKANKISQSPDKSGSFEMTKNQNPASVISTNEERRNLNYDDDAKKIIRNALLDSVRSHLVSDVEVGAFLSGGIDSTAIVSLMRQVGQEKIKTVSVVFPNNKLDESKYSRLAAKYYKTEHIEIPFYEKDLLEDFEKIMASMDQPTIDGINTYFVSKAAKQAGLKVVLSGLGGDELFGGYPSFLSIPKYQRIKNLPFTKSLMKAAAPLLKNRLPAKAIEYFKNPNLPNSEYKMIRGLFTDSELQKLGWDFQSQKSKVKSQKDLLVTDHSSLITISELETTFYMRNQLLRDSDVFSMAHSLELRVPFVDHLLYKSVLPYLDSAFNKNYPKKMLVDAVGDIPLELINRPKMGFTFPFAEWMSSGKLKESMMESLNSLGSKLNIDHSALNINQAHWSRRWALFILGRMDD